MIDESLAALPVYLSGCKELLVVAGATYTTRLWVRTHASREPIAQPDSLPAACAPCLLSLIPKRVRMGTFPPLFPAFSA